jgi:pimeloyl-ACP methyl ester carboxylesterase
MTQAPTTVTSADGVRLAVYESGAPTAPPVVAVHGYPDNHSLWDDVAELLQPDLRVVTYDVRGAGASDKPVKRGSYRISHLIDDLLAVLDVVSPDRPVHLVGHDWGSIQCWSAVTDERLTGRIATFTSISGPSLDYAGRWLRQAHKHPGAALRQVGHSYYSALFQLPRLPEFAARRGLIDSGTRRAGRPPVGTGESTRRAQRLSDAIYGIELYRANFPARLSRPRPVPTAVPVQLIVPDKDAFVTAELAVEAAKPWVADLTVVPVSGGHWLVNSHPEQLARLVREFARTHDAAERPA